MLGNTFCTGLSMSLDSYTNTSTHTTIGCMSPMLSGLFTITLWKVSLHIRDDEVKSMYIELT
jgi:hypothetical protein